MRRAIQQSQESLATLAERYALHPKTVAQWQKRAFVQDAPRGPNQPRATVLPKEADALMVGCRTPPLRPLDAGLSAVQATLPHRTRSAWQRCWQRHGLSRLPEGAGDRPQKQPFTRDPSGYCHSAIAAVRTEDGTLGLCMAIDRTAQFADAELPPSAPKSGAAQCLRHLIAAVPERLPTMLTDNGLQFTPRDQDT